MRELKPRDDLVILTCAEMGRADAAAIAGGVPGIDLMEAAGRAVADAVTAHHARQPVVVLCGPGNNGGDGFVAGRHLQARRWPVRLGLLGERRALKGDAAWAAATWAGEAAPLTLDLLDGRPLVIDALFGAGLTRPIQGIAGDLIDRINGEALTTVAVDVPSGLHGDSGEIMGRAPMATRTVTFFRAKPGHYSLEGLRRCGALEVADIGITPTVLREIAPRLWLNAPALWQSHLRRTDRGDHKYARGHATILAGEIATGAARLAALGARRAGAGLVTIATPPAALAVYQAAEPGNLVTVCKDGDAFARLLEDERRNAILVGPGSGVGERTRNAALAALATRRPVVLDADAITVFARSPAELFAAVQGQALLTPHEGEFRRLFPDLVAIPAKVERARQAARLSGATVLLKGSDTVIAAPDGRAVINVHASPGLATAGAGDVLAGIAAGLLAQGLSAFAAAAAAAWLHGDCALRFGHPGLIAEDLVGQIPYALQAALAAN
ncbi:NAD(P)H-hydrate dehydratase [Reyranella soli]|uniref:Bifunctional NAD(P)H-hydrate repair enzyme n=1 Tax=Reyranella soli TaxID=1230389 RepID=A0A512N753_9HYPH|nr:NAD(P)H-hydrate dehydratase [Reyranella soli]GEP54817.1 bifunctional NAD(P)H-hydrate repair enzyme [Reyranella soli]